MNAAPGVLVDFSDACPAWTAATRVLAACIATGLTAWAALHHLNGQDLITTWFATGISGTSIAALAWLLRAPAPRGRLIWNTREWHWQDGATPIGETRALGCGGTAHIALDLGDWLLVRFRGNAEPNVTIWLPLSRTSAASNWHGLNCALRQRSTLDAPDSAEAEQAHRNP